MIARLVYGERGNKSVLSDSIGAKVKTNQTGGEMMKKIEYAEIIVASPAWDGIKSAQKLAKMYTLAELKDMYSMLHDAEEDYYSGVYGD